MKVIDLSQPLYSGMPVYPGDPEVKIQLKQTIDKEGWNLRTLLMSTHLGTHVNVPGHMVKGGRSLDDYPAEAFWGEAIVYTKGTTLSMVKKGSTLRRWGIIFRDYNIDQKIAEDIIKHKRLIKFVGLAAEFEFDVEIERQLLQEGIISFENLVNCDRLPKNKPFVFYGFPLKIREGDGSPIRAIAVI